jgi:hypothetical protein
MPMPAFQPVEGVMKLPASSTTALHAAMGRLATRLRQLSLRAAPVPAAGAQPPLPPALGAYGLLVGDDHRRG